MATINKVLGKGSRITLDGQEYRFSGLTLGVQGDYQDWFLARLRSKAGRSPEVLTTIAEREAAGEYDFWSQAVIRSISAPAGAIKLVQLLLIEPELTEEQTAELFQKHAERLQQVVVEALDVGN